MKAISFSLFGNKPIYTTGMIENVRIARELYPDWQVVVYWSSVPKQTIKRLEQEGAVCRPGKGKNGMFWRFAIAWDKQVERFLIRDADSRLNPREKRAVDEWIESGLKFHVIRDHPHHTYPVMGGTWGAVPFSELVKALQSYQPPSDFYTEDQIFLARTIWPLVREQTLQHDLCTRNLWPDARPFPADGERFCGERIDENGNPDPYGWQQRLEAIYT